MVKVMWVIRMKIHLFPACYIVSFTAHHMKGSQQCSLYIETQGLNALEYLMQRTRADVISSNTEVTQDSKPKTANKP